jgi:hypothetical protein
MGSKIDETSLVALVNERDGVLGLRMQRRAQLKTVKDEVVEK